MAYVYVLRHGTEDVFKIGRTKGTIAQTIEQLSRGNPYQLTEVAQIETEDAVACETYLHQRLRSKKVVAGGGNEFFRLDWAELNTAIRDAKEYVSEYLAAKRQADELSRTEPDLQALSVRPTATDLEMYSKLLKIREAQDRLKVQRDYCESKLKLSIGLACALEGIATWKGQWRHNFDVLTFRATEPDIYAEMYRRFGSDSYARIFRIQRFT